MRVRSSAGPILALAAVLAACGQSPGPGESTIPLASSGGQTAFGQPDLPGDAVADASRQPVVAAGVAIPDRVGDLALDVLSYSLDGLLDAPGGDRVTELLDRLALDASEVELIVAVAPLGQLSIGHWVLPDRDAGAIRDAWAASAGPGWESVTLLGEQAFSGRGPDGSRAWAAARDGLLVYVVTEDPRLAELTLEAIG